MASSADGQMPISLLMRRSNTESICTSCFQPIRTKSEQSQHIEEAIHKVSCPASSEDLNRDQVVVPLRRRRVQFRTNRIRPMCLILHRRGLELNCIVWESCRNQ
jgi:hypothetical protein